MESKRLKRKYAQCVLITLFIYFLLPSHIYSDFNSMSGIAYEDREIVWIAEFSSSEEFPKSKSITTLIYNFILGTENHHLIRPMSVIALQTGVLSVLDQGSRSLVHIDTNKYEMNFFRPSEASSFNSLIALCVTKNHDILFTDSNDSTIYRHSPQSGKLEKLNASLRLSRPTGIGYLISEDQIWVVETGAHRISILDQFGNLIKHIGHRGTAAGEFNYPTFLWIDDTGVVYVVDSMNFRIQVLDSRGQILRVFGKPGDASGYFARPKGIATDSFGHIYVTDALFHTVQIFDKEGNFLYNFGRQGREQGEFWMPAGIYIDPEDRIYIADSYNARIQIFQLR